MRHCNRNQLPNTNLCVVALVFVAGPGQGRVGPIKVALKKPIIFATAFAKNQKPNKNGEALWVVLEGEIETTR